MQENVGVLNFYKRGKYDNLTKFLVLEIKRDNNILDHKSLIKLHNNLRITRWKLI